MPILVKDYSWAETEETLRITVPLKGVPANKADIFTTEDYLKVSYPPYLFEVCLFDAVYDSKGKAKVGNGIIDFSLEKKKKRMWDQLLSTESENKEFMKKKRESAIDVAHKRAKEEKERRAEEQRAQEKYALRQQMELEERERKRIEEEKEEESRRATEAIERWKEKQSEAQLQLLANGDEDSEEDHVGGTKMAARKGVSYHKQLSGDADNEHGSASDDEIGDVAGPEMKNNISPRKQNCKQRKKKSPAKSRGKDLLEKSLPDPRAAGSIQVSFTPRSFKTAARESKAPEEEEWLKKVAKANQAKPTAENPDAIDMEEMNPLWLKDKGMGFYKAQNYVAAINAFTAGIVLDGSIPAAACHLHIKQYKECVQDCTSALELLTPAVPANANSRCKAHVRRGTAYFQMEYYVQALQDYECALKLDPHNATLRADAERIRNIIQGTT